MRGIQRATTIAHKLPDGEGVVPGRSGTVLRGGVGQKGGPVPRTRDGRRASACGNTEESFGSGRLATNDQGSGVARGHCIVGKRSGRGREVPSKSREGVVR